MHLITERSVIREVADRWDKQYPPGTANNDRVEISKHLRVLNLETATASDLERIIGNGSWTRTPVCSECGAKEVPVVQVGQEPDYESLTAYLCRVCIEKALKLFDQP